MTDDPVIPPGQPDPSVLVGYEPPFGGEPVWRSGGADSIAGGPDPWPHPSASQSAALAALLPELEAADATFGHLDRPRQPVQPPQPGFEDHPPIIRIGEVRLDLFRCHRVRHRSSPASSQPSPPQPAWAGTPRVGRRRYRGAHSPAQGCVRGC